MACGRLARMAPKPMGMSSSGSLAKAKLPEPISALEPYKERLHIINGLHGLHTSPAHSAFFGALGGYRGSDGVPPSAPTIDYELSKVLPQTLLPHLCIGMDSLENMTSKPTIAGAIFSTTFSTALSTAPFNVKAAFSSAIMQFF